MRLITAEEMQTIDRQAIEDLGIPGVVLMENAGRAASESFCRELTELFPGPVLVMAGKGNNGGDGYVMARILADQGWQVETIVLGAPEDIHGDAGTMLDILVKLGSPVHFAGEARELRSRFSAVGPEIIIDALLGTGLRSSVRGLYAEAIEIINSAGVRVLSVDIPSGVSGSTGQICGVAVKADLTVTFDHGKIGHGTDPGAGFCGYLDVVDIGIPLRGRSEPESEVWLTEVDEALEWLPERPERGHKGSFGHLLLISGSTGKSGAAALAGLSAVRSGCGLVTVGAPASIHEILEVKLTEAMTFPLNDRNGQLGLDAQPQITRLLEGKGALALGPGLGQSAELVDLVAWLVQDTELPLVIDADGLNLLAGQLSFLQQRQGPVPVLTPHPGEMARLCGRSVAEVEADRFQLTREFARQHQVVLLLKGPRTLIAAPDGRMRINATGNVGLASGGSGDVLTGVIGGLLAQGVDSFDAAALGAWLHGRAADLVAMAQGVAGMAASDLLSHLALARRELSEGV